MLKIYLHMESKRQSALYPPLEKPKEHSAL